VEAAAVNLTGFLAQVAGLVCVNSATAAGFLGVRKAQETKPFIFFNDLAQVAEFRRFAPLVNVANRFFDSALTFAASGRAGRCESCKLPRRCATGLTPRLGFCYEFAIIERFGPMRLIVVCKALEAGRG